MKLTTDEFHRIRPLQWTTRVYGNKSYNTLVDSTETQLFWLDFMAHVFAPRFKSQSAISKITNFNTESPVMITDDLTLTLPADLASVIYYSDRERVREFVFRNIGIATVSVVSVILLLILLVVHALTTHRKIKLSPISELM